MILPGTRSSSLTVIELETDNFQPEYAGRLNFRSQGIDGATAMTHFSVNSSIESFPAFRLNQSIRCCCNTNNEERTVTSGTNRVGGSGWDDVQVGDKVQLLGNGRPEYVGLVDARTADGDIIWVHDPLEGRRLFHIQDGYELQLAAS